MDCGEIHLCYKSIPNYAEVYGSKQHVKGSSRPDVRSAAMIRPSRGSKKSITRSEGFITGNEGLEEAVHILSQPKLRNAFWEKVYYGS